MYACMLLRVVKLGCRIKSRMLMPRRTVCALGSRTRVTIKCRERTFNTKNTSSSRYTGVPPTQTHTWQNPQPPPKILRPTIRKRKNAAPSSLPQWYPCPAGLCGWRAFGRHRTPLPPRIENCSTPVPIRVLNTSHQRQTCTYAAHTAMPLP